MLLFAAAAAGASFTCQPSAVWDGDTFHCEERMSNGATNVRKLRVAGIAAREVRNLRRNGGHWFEDAGCSPGHPCPKTDAIAARKALAGLFGGVRGVGPYGHLLVRGPLLTCQANGTTGDRVAAWCSSAVTGDVSCWMVRKGYALRWSRYWKRQLCL
jgi:endonuclease YncB( thermonuclease family)